jgi:L,D-transpeptidase catalytic domain
VGRPRRIPLGGTATLVAVAVAVGCSEHKTTAPISASAPEATGTQTTVAKVRPKERAPRQKPERAAPKPKPGHAKPKRGEPQHRPAKPSVPWHGNAMSLVAHARQRRLAVYVQPQAKRPLLLLRNPDGNGTPRVVLVRSERPGWVHVYLPTRPNGGSGWVREEAVRLLRDPYRVVVYVRRHRLELWRFAGGDGRVGIHGTNEPWLLGSSVSHGCVRVRNDMIRRLARMLPLGTPVLIRR